MGAETMGMKAADVLKHVDFKNMSKADKAALKKKLNSHKADLKKSMDAVDKALAAIAKK
jgi:hypothetical protein